MRREKRYYEAMSETNESIPFAAGDSMPMIAPLAGNPLANVLSNKESLEALASIYIANKCREICWKFLLRYASFALFGI